MSNDPTKKLVNPKLSQLNLIGFAESSRLARNSFLSHRSHTP